MTTETQILQELVEAVEKLNNPDLLSVGATVLAAVVAAVITYVLGKRQNELQKQQLKIQERQNELQAQQVKLQEQQNRQQEQQTKLQEQQIRQQEYAIYSQLYKLVSSSNVEINAFLENIHHSFWGRNYYRADKGYFKEKKEYIDKLLNELEQNALDFEIKFSKDFFNISDYRTVLTQMSIILQLLNEFVEKDMIYMEMGSSIRMSYPSDKENEAYAQNIAEHIKDIKVRPLIYAHILSFAKARDKVREGGNDILEKIRERCKVE